MPSVLTPGNFDGVHLGHRALVRAVCEGARARGVEGRAMFFDPHPAAHFRPEDAPLQLTSVARRSDLLRRVGIDTVDVRRFDEAFAAQSPIDFVQDVLVRDHGVREVVVGPDFRFGRERAGDLATLRALGREHGFDVTVVDPVVAEGGVVSSTRVRAALAEGDVALAAALLGRFHDVDGVVSPGDRRGRTIGFPTANLQVETALPADGVYAVACRVVADGDVGGHEKLLGVANLGVRPTFGAGRSVEVHLLDFDGDLYGRALRVAFVARLRGEVRFDGIDALVAQLGRDVAAGRESLTRADPELLAWM
ncbi:MAG: bifunctional riboflavin kinase/FAD synthetase [Myxococcales bacterium]|nr:bifunctional riboflavin kinase/FAD synthetase [Myxococcales bacterium]